jgi:hypothetical protein
VEVDIQMKVGLIGTFHREIIPHVNIGIFPCVKKMVLEGGPEDKMRPWILLCYFFLISIDGSFSNEFIEMHLYSCASQHSYKVDRYLIMS